MNSNQFLATVNNANNQQVHPQNKKQIGGGVTYLIVSLIAIWLAELFIAQPKEIEI